MTAYNFDKHVHYIGTYFENLMQQKDMTSAKAFAELESADLYRSGKSRKKSDFISDLILSLKEGK